LRGVKNIVSRTFHFSIDFSRVVVPFFVWVLVFLSDAGTSAQAQDVTAKATVTYLSGNSVYVSAGRNAGVVDSTLLYAVAKTDTIAVLKVFAVSSKSAVCSIISSKRTLLVGDVVVGIVSLNQVVASPTPASVDSAGRYASPPRSGVAARAAAPSVSVQGRVALQYHTSQFENSIFNINQPGLIMGLRASARDIPLSLEVYGNMRMLSRGGTNPFSGQSTNDSRIYRLALEYDDHVNTVTLGRILSYYAPSIGSIDGIAYTRKVGNFAVGAAVGFQPDLMHQGVQTDTRKMSIYARYQDAEMYNMTVTTAYARTYVSSQLDREALSLGVTAYASDGFSIYGYTDVDIRKKVDSRFDFSPSLASGIFMLNCRLFEFLSLGAGVDASRPVYQFSTVQYMADSLVDRTLRSGATLSINLQLPNGMSLYNTYTPRVSDGRFGNDYSNSSSFSWYNLFSSGMMVRASYNLTSNDFTTAQGYGVYLQRNIFGVDLTARYQQSKYRISQLEETNASKTYGLDIMTLLTNRLTWMMSFDAVQGYGSPMKSVFTELSLRF
jgi:hypothetical protein